MPIYGDRVIFGVSFAITVIIFCLGTAWFLRFFLRRVDPGISNAVNQYLSDILPIQIRALAILVVASLLFIVGFFVEPFFERNFTAQEWGRRFDDPMLVEQIARAERSRNLNYALRAVALGGLGAIITLVAQGIIRKEENQVQFLRHPAFWSDLVSRPILGACVSLIAFALLYTKQISIFQPETTNPTGVPHYPDFWRVTLLCLISGAFADRIYGAAAARVRRYLEEEQERPSER